MDSQCFVTAVHTDVQFYIDICGMRESRKIEILVSTNTPGNRKSHVDYTTAQGSASPVSVIIREK